MTRMRIKTARQQKNLSQREGVLHKVCQLFFSLIGKVSEAVLDEPS